MTDIQSEPRASALANTKAQDHSTYLICHITTVHSPHDTRVLHKECVSLAKAGYQVVLLALSATEEHRHSDNLRIQPVGRIYRRRLTRMMFGARAAYREALKLHASVYHFHDPEFLPYARKLVRKGYRVIYDAHEDVPLQVQSKHYLPSVIRKPLSWLVRRYENYAMRKLTAVIVVTPPMLPRVERNNRLSAIVMNMPLLSEFPPPPPWETRENAIAYVGGLTVSRGMIQLVETMEYLDHKLYLAGSFSPLSLESKLSAMAGWKQVDYLGYLSRKDVLHLNHRVKIGIITPLPDPNNLIGLYTKMFEYMACAIPVLVSDFPLLREIVTRLKCGICVNPTKPHEIAEAINYLFSHQQEAETMGWRGRKAVENGYNWHTAGEHPLLTLYSKVLASFPMGMKPADEP